MYSCMHSIFSFYKMFISGQILQMRPLYVIVNVQTHVFLRGGWTTQQPGCWQLLFQEFSWSRLHKRNFWMDSRMPLSSLNHAAVALTCYACTARGPAGAACPLLCALSLAGAASAQLSPPLLQLNKSTPRWQNLPQAVHIHSRFSPSLPLEPTDALSKIDLFFFWKLLIEWNSDFFGLFLENGTVLDYVTEFWWPGVDSGALKLTCCFAGNYPPLTVWQWRAGGNTTPKRITRRARRGGTGQEQGGKWGRPGCARMSNEFFPSLPWVKTNQADCKGKSGGYVSYRQGLGWVGGRGHEMMKDREQKGEDEDSEREMSDWNIPTNAASHKHIVNSTAVV